MNYQQFKAQRDELLSQFFDNDSQNKEILSFEDYNELVCLVEEFSELSRKMLQRIKQLEQIELTDFELGK